MAHQKICHLPPMHEHPVLKICGWLSHCWPTACFPVELHEGTASTCRLSHHSPSIQTRVCAIHLQAFNGVKALILSAIFTDVQLGNTIWPALQYEGPAGAGDRIPSAARQVASFALICVQSSFPSAWPSVAQMPLRAACGTKQADGFRDHVPPM